VASDPAQLGGFEVGHQHGHLADDLIRGQMLPEPGADGARLSVTRVDLQDVQRLGIRMILGRQNPDGTEIDDGEWIAW